MKWKREGKRTGHMCHITVVRKNKTFYPLGILLALSGAEFSWAELGPSLEIGLTHTPHQHQAREPATGWKRVLTRRAYLETVELEHWDRHGSEISEM